MKKLSEKRQKTGLNTGRRILRAVYRGLGVIAAALLLQTCSYPKHDEAYGMYGPPPDENPMYPMYGPPHAVDEPEETDEE